MKDPKTSTTRSSGSEKSFEETQFQVTRLMEVAGGSANAYDRPPDSLNPDKSTENVEGNPFAEGDESPPDHGLVVEDEAPSEHELVLVDGEPTTKSGFGGCITFMPEMPRPGGRPDGSIDDNRYELYAAVEQCGELANVWRALTKTLMSKEGATAKLDTGEATYERGPNNCWILDDPVKNKRYLLESSDLQGLLDRNHDSLLWVMAIDDSDQDFGYIHNGYVFLVKEEKP